MTPFEIAIDALQLIASPMRPDGTWNRDREACRKLAFYALWKMGAAVPETMEEDDDGETL